MKQSTQREYARLADKAFDAWLEAEELRDPMYKELQMQVARHYAKKPSKWFLMEHFNIFIELNEAKELAEELKN